MDQQRKTIISGNIMATKSKKQNPVKIGRVNLDNPAERKRVT